MRQDDPHRYDDIIGLPHHRSATRPHMPPADRAAQVSPFAALTGYEAVIAETARLTDRRIELDEDAKTALAQKLQIVAEHIRERPEITVTWFRPDEKKDGGAYITAAGAVRRIDGYGQAILMADGTKVPVCDVAAIEGELLRRYATSN